MAAQVTGSDVKRVRVTVAGAVQGVGFRYTAKAEADRIGVTGWIRNVGVDRVETEVQGDAHAVARFVAWAHRGPADANVTAVDVTDVEVVGAETEFRIRASG